MEANEIIDALASSQSSIAANEIMTARQVSARLGGVPILDATSGQTLEANRHYVVDDNAVLILPTIAEDMDGSLITIWQLGGSLQVQYTSPATELFTNTFTIDENVSSNQILFRATYSSTASDCLWIVKSDIYSSASTTDSPIGALAMFPIDSIPDNYIGCYGTSLSRVEYSDLFNYLGTSFGSVDDDHFNLPDYRGYHLRCWDHGAGVDPDAATRADRGDGTAGDNPGTIQEDELGSHRHTYTQVGGGNGIAIGNGLTMGPAHTGYQGGDETRPKNISVVVAIKHTEAVVDLGAYVTPCIEFNVVTTTYELPANPQANTEYQFVKMTTDSAEVTTPTGAYINGTLEGTLANTSGNAWECIRLRPIYDNTGEYWRWVIINETGTWALS